MQTRAARFHVGGIADMVIGEAVLPDWELEETAAIVRRVPQGLKPGGWVGFFGKAEAVPLSKTGRVELALPTHLGAMDGAPEKLSGVS